MKTRLALLGLFLLTAGAMLAACGGDGKPSDSGGGGDGEGGEDFSRPDPPAEYADIEKPDFTDAMVEEGEKLFTTNCATCHGQKGEGDGPAGAALTPKAQDLTNPALQDAISDHYIYWRISEGGAALGYTGMTPFKESLNDEQHWQVVAFIRSLKGE